MYNTHIVIMAGGIGSRLWPLSTPSMPKQFIDVLGVGKSLLRLTYERFLPVCKPSNVWVVTSEVYTDIVKEQLPEIPVENILSEPEPRNTAPCIAYACSKIEKKDSNANIVVAPSDAIILREERFAKVISNALEHTADKESIVTIGIAPDHPETGYGYIKASKVAPDEVVKVLEFKEKPDEKTAAYYLEQGNYFWNAGIFVWHVHTIMTQLRRHVPDIVALIDKIAEHFDTPQEEKALKEYFPQCEKISIDYAVMEKSKAVYVIASDLNWSDLGSWSSVKKYIPNSVIGNGARLYDCENCVVHVTDGRNVVIEGLKNYVVAEKDGDFLVCRLENEQLIKDFSSKLAFPRKTPNTK